jgi:lysophospholipase L1-like esterase
MKVRHVRALAVTIAATVAATAVVALTLPAAQAATGDGSPGDPNIAFVGRWDRSNASAYVPNWAGAYFKTGFTGTSVKLKQRRTIDLYYSIDGRADVYLTNVSGTVNLTPTPLAAGNHTLRVSYRVVAGSYTGDAVFQGLILDSGATTRPAAVSPRLVEFVGDSITVGTTSSKNALTAYGWLVGEQLGVEHTQIGYGGGCLVATADGCVSVASQFLRTGYSASSPLWDFSRYQANVVVINLGTNDKSHAVSSTNFQNGYVAFLRTVRSKYPNAVILALRTFSNRYSAETQAAVNTVAATDSRVKFVDTTGWLPANGLSDSVHPNDAGHQAIAAKLAPIVSAALATSPTTAPTTRAPVTSRPPATSAAPVTSGPPATSAAPTTTVSTSAAPTTRPVVTSAPATAGGCRVSYKLTNQWQGGFGADVTITNLGNAVSSWTLTWAFATGQTVTQVWNATVTQSGTAVAANNVSYNGAIATNGTVNFGFNGAWTTANPVPAAFVLNGTACAAG